MTAATNPTSGAEATEAAGVGARRALLDGVAAALPATLFIAPFAALCGVVAAETGLSLGETIAFSVLVFAGAAQLAALELMRAGAPWIVVAVSGLVVNLRFVLYSATLAPYFRRLSFAAKSVVAYCTVDNAVSGFLSWRRRDAATPRERALYVVAIGAHGWLVWQSFTIVGHQLGPLMDAEALRIVAPVAFLALATPLLTSAPRWAVAIVAAALAVALKGRAAHLDLLVAAGVAVAVGQLFPAPDPENEDPADEKPEGEAPEGEGAGRARAEDEGPAERGAAERDGR